MCKSHREGGTWVAQWIEASAFGSGHSLRVPKSGPKSGSLLSGEPVFLSLSLCLPLCLLVISLSLCQINKIFKKKNKTTYISNHIIQKV